MRVSGCDRALRLAMGTALPVVLTEYGRRDDVENARASVTRRNDISRQREI